MTRRGSMLVEALIAVVIMAVGMTVLTQALMNNSNVVNVVSGYGRSWLIINEKLQEKHFWDKVNIPLENQPLDSPLEKFKYSLVFSPFTKEPMQGLKQMDMTIAQVDGEKTRSISLRTIIPNDQSIQTKRSIFYN